MLQNCASRNWPSPKTKVLGQLETLHVCHIGGSVGVVDLGSIEAYIEVIYIYRMLVYIGLYWHI